MAKDFFISYTGVDRERAEWIAWQLKEAGYSVVLQAWDFRPGDNFILKMHEASKEAKRTIAVLTPDYLKSTPSAAFWPLFLAFPRFLSSSALFALHPSVPVTSHERGVQFCAAFAHQIMG